MAIVQDRALNQAMHDSIDSVGFGDETAMRVLLSDSDGTVAELDHGYQVVISIEHHKIHDGDHYTSQDYDSEVDIGTPKYWLVVAPSAPNQCHLTAMVRSSKNGLVEIFGDSVVSDNGTPVDIYNNNTTSSNTPSTTFYVDPTVTSDGNRRCVNVMGTDSVSPAGDAGGIGEREHEWIIQDNSFLIKFTTLTNDNRVSLCIDFYEV